MGENKVCSLKNGTVDKFYLFILHGVWRKSGFESTYASFYISFCILKMVVKKVPTRKDCFKY